MKALITYYSQTGNTEKIARAIYEAIYFDKEILAIRDVKNLQGYDIIFAGFPVQAHSVPAAFLPFFKKLPAGQNIALFCTHGSLRGGHLPKQAIEHADRPRLGGADPRHLLRPGEGPSQSPRLPDDLAPEPCLGRRGIRGVRTSR